MDGKIATSADGTTGWAQVGTSPLSSSSRTAIAFGGGKFVAISGGAINAYSPDGTSWTTITTQLFDGFSSYAITFGNNKFVIAGTNQVRSSTDCINWTNSSNARAGTQVYAIAYGAGKFVAGGGYGGISYSSGL